MTEGVEWPRRDIVIGLVILLLFGGVSYGLWSLDQFKYRFWISRPAWYALFALEEAYFLLYPLYVFRERGFNPLLLPVSVGKIVREFFISFFLALLISIAIGLIIRLLAFLFETQATPPEFLQQLRFAPNSILLIVTFTLGFTITPLAEELFFRGFIYNALKSHSSVGIAMVVQAAFFALLHGYSWLNTLGIFLVGIALAEVYEMRRTLLAPIFMHVTINATLFVPILILMAGNLHTPAATWEEAKTAPKWMRTSPSEETEKQENGMEQWQYAIDTWGTAGSRQWKKEANAFNAVCDWFPDDREACAKAKLGIVAIYCNHLRDYRRAVVEADELLARYSDQKEACALAFAYRGWAYYFLRDFEKSKESFKKVIDDFGEYDEAVEYARQGIARLNVVLEE